MCLDQGPQRSDAGEARTRGLSVLSQALYHWATALPYLMVFPNQNIDFEKKSATDKKSTQRVKAIHNVQGWNRLAILKNAGIYWRICMLKRH